MDGRSARDRAGLTPEKLRQLGVRRRALTISREPVPADGPPIPEQRGSLELRRAVGLVSAPAASEQQVESVDTGQRFAYTVIVPTRNESGNVKPLVERLEAVLPEESASILFVDDSDDDTPRQVEHAMATSRITVRLHHRSGKERTGGLGGAVLAGLRRANAPWVVIMDGDLQHPPELVPELVAAGERDSADVVVASRHVAGGSSEGLANGVRVLVSDLSILLSKAFFPRRLKGVSDPMSGFFAVRTGAFDLDSMRPAGFKILLEMLARTPSLKKSEVGFVFGERQSGESKASLREGVRFVKQLLRLSLSRLSLSRNNAFGRSVGFGLVGITGIGVNLGAMWALADPTTLGLNYLVAAALATQISSTWNFALTDSVVYRGPKRLTRVRRWLGFVGLSNVVLILRIPLLALLVGGLGMHYLPATAITLLLGFLVRFQSQERLTLPQKELS